MQADNPEDLNLLFYDFNKQSKQKNSRKMKRTSQILEATEENEDDEDYTLDRQFPDIGSSDQVENSFDKRKHTDIISSVPAEDIIKGIKAKETPMSINSFWLNYIMNSKNKKDIGQRTMINWAKKDRMPTRGIHTRGGRRRERITKN